MTREIAIKTAAKWWAEIVKGNEIHSNDESHPGNVLGLSLRAMAANPTFRSQTEVFKLALEQEIDHKLAYVMYLECDYFPCDLLNRVAERAGISTFNFPLKTRMEIRGDGEDYTVSVSEGNVVKWVELSPCE